MSKSNKEFLKVTIIDDLEQAKEFIKTKREPFILKNFDYGACLTNWTVDYLKERVKNKIVKVHVSSFSNMDFLNKNFLYRTLPFDELIKRASEDKHQEYFIDENEKYYLRSLGVDDRKDIADVSREFPELAKDVVFPCLFEQNQFFSSVFRISSKNLRLWTHYDIMDNILIQFTGSKRVILFPPTEVDYLYMNGDKSEVLEVDDPDLNKYPLFTKAKKYECELNTGESIFIPALWFHNVITNSFSIGINVFWKHLDESFYDNKDVYGNKDLNNAQKAFLFNEKAIKELNQMPNDYKIFYTKRIIQRLLQNFN